jgi:hypothetical protein
MSATTRTSRSHLACGTVPRVLAALLSLAASTAWIAAGPARAAPVAFTHTLAGPAVCLSAGSPDPCHGSIAGSVPGAELDHVLPAYLTAPGYALTAAELHLQLADDFGQGDGSEKLDLWVDGTRIVSNADANHDQTILLTNLAWLADGYLEVRVAAGRGDFFLLGSTLSVTGETVALDTATAPGGRVPAPGGLGLLAAGGVLLAVLRGRARRGTHRS